MRLARLCIHDRVDAHGTCPGGEFLPEGALVVILEALRFYGTVDAFAALDALASQVGESE